MTPTAQFPDPTDGQADRPRNRFPVAELKALIGQTTRLLRLEVELAKGELAGKAGAVAASAGLVIGAALLGLLALCVVTTAAVLALATAVAAWLAALIVFVALLALAGSLAVLGLRTLKRAAPLVPERAIESLKGDLKWVETQLRSAER